MLFIVLAIVGALDGFVCLQFPQEQPQLGTVERAPAHSGTLWMLASALADDDDHQHIAFGPSGEAITPAGIAVPVHAGVPVRRASDTTAVAEVRVALPALGPRGPPPMSHA